MTTEQRIETLSRQIRTLRLALTALAATTCVATLAAFTGQDEPVTGRFDELTVGRLVVAGPDGVQRLVLAHEMPQAPFQGRMLERSVPPGLAGMIFCAPNGDEVGGIGASDAHTLITVDYRDTPLEAIGFVQRRDGDEQYAGLVMMENPTGTIDIDKIAASDPDEVGRFQAMMVQRGWLGVERHEAALTLRDRDGRDRLVLRVDEHGEPALLMLDEFGSEVLALP